MKRKKVEEVKKPISSPDIEVDWFNPTAVHEYYNSFDRWSFYISGACKYENACVEIKNGLALHNQRYYLPSGGSHEDWCSKKTEFIEDGWYYVRLYKKGYGYYNTMPTVNYAYVFQLHDNTKPYTKEQVDSFNARNNYQFKSTYKNISEEDINHIKSLNLAEVNSKELDFIKHNMYHFFKEFLPFKAKNGVYINKWESFDNPLATQKGLIYIDNGYRGSMVNNMDYSVMLQFHPSFSNEHQYYKGVYIKSFTADALEQIALKIEESVKQYCKL